MTTRAHPFAKVIQYLRMTTRVCPGARQPLPSIPQLGRNVKSFFKNFFNFSINRSPAVVQGRPAGRLRLLRNDIAAVTWVACVIAATSCKKTEATLRLFINELRAATWGPYVDPGAAIPAGLFTKNLQFIHKINIDFFIKI